MKAWYFSTSDRVLRYGDGRPITLGVTHTHDGEPVLYYSGLHASMRAIDALRFAPGPVLWRVECGGTLVHGEDKLVCTERTYIDGGVDASSMLRAFARWCALSVAHLWDCPDVVARWLVTGDESLRAAARAATWNAASAATWNAARAATWNAARGAGWNAARNAASAATRGAGWNAARDAASAATRGAARDAASAAAKAAALNAAASTAAWDAARAAARAAQSTQFKKMCEDLLKGNHWWEVEHE